MVNLFANIGQKSKEKLLKLFLASTVKFTKGINIISYMNRKETIGIVESGKIEIYISDEEGNMILMDELHENDIFGGLISSIILDDECIIKTKEESVITFIDYDQITNTDFIKSEFYNTFIQNLLKIIFEQISLKNERIQVITKKTTRDKLLTYFNIMHQKQFSNKVIELPSTYTDLANYLSVDRSAMMREIKNLKDDGVITINNKKIYLNF